MSSIRFFGYSYFFSCNADASVATIFSKVSPEQMEQIRGILTSRSLKSISDFLFPFLIEPEGGSVRVEYSELVKIHTMRGVCPAMELEV